MSEDKKPASAEAVDQGHWENGVWVAPKGWPEGAAWVVQNEDGTFAQWGPASDLALIVTTQIGDPSPLPPASQLGASFAGRPVPGTGDE